MKIRKRHNKKIHRGKGSLYYNQITIGLQLGYNQSHHLLHLESTQHKQPHIKKKKKEQEKEAKDKGERQNEGKENEMEIKKNVEAKDEEEGEGIKGRKE